MSIFHNLQIVPQSNTLIKLVDIKIFISKLASNGYIEKGITILTGDDDKIKNISFWDFNDTSVSSDLTKESKLEIVKEENFENLSNAKNYAFKIHLTKTSSLLENLEVFKATDRETFPIFISFFSEPIDFTVTKEDEETEEFEEITVSNVNCIIKSSGRNSESLWGLVENRNEFQAFFEEVIQFLGEVETGTYFD